MRMRAFAGLVALVLASGMALAAELPSPCELVRASDLKTLFPDGPGGPGKLDKRTPGAASCTYEWGSGGNPEKDNFTFSIVVGDASKMFPGMSPEAIKSALLVRAAHPRPGQTAEAIPGVGEAAVYESIKPIESEVMALVKGMILTVHLVCPDGRGKKDKVVSLLKTAAATL